jgi:hypothetical protein
MVLESSLFIECALFNNCRLHGRLEEAKQWLAEGEADFRAAAAYRDFPGALLARSTYLWLRDRTTESLDAENREAGRRGVDSSACLSYLASLFRQGKTDDALEYLRTVQEGRWDHLPFARVLFLVGRDVEAARAECRRALASGVRSRYRPYLCYALSLAGMPDEARRQAKVFRENSGGTLHWATALADARRAAGHAYEGIPLDVETETADSRWKRFTAYDTLGFAALGRGERENALQWFRKAAQHPPLLAVNQQLMQAMRERVINDPNWPPWLAEKK